MDNIRMDLGEVGWNDMDWIGLALERSCEFGIEPSGYNFSLRDNFKRLSTL
jgi:hypothetical protein